MDSNNEEISKIYSIGKLKLNFEIIIGDGFLSNNGNDELTFPIHYDYNEKKLFDDYFNSPDEIFQIVDKKKE